MIKDSSLKKVKEYQKYKDLYDRTSLECNCSFWGAVLVCFVLYKVMNNTNIENINKIFDMFTKDIAIALIGFLGFTVSGLAILTGVISKKEVSKTAKADKLDKLERILLSFYLLGLIIGITIIGHIVLFIFVSSDMCYDLRIVMVATFVFSYLDIFIIFYSIKLLGNCLSIFFIVNEIEEEKAKDFIKKSDIKSIYNSYRLTALEVVCLEKMEVDDVKRYKKIIAEQITQNDKLKVELEKMYKEHFSIDE